MEPIMVTVVCLTYNHEKYIRQALKSMLAQKTNFPYEILVHDDASTDGTTKIIQEMAGAHPTIRLICQTENQYSKGVNIFTRFIIPEIKGKYVAFCEGDDFWTSPLKLYKQVTLMERHPKAALCIHNAIRVNRYGKRIGTVNTTDRSRKISCEEVIIGGGGFCATNSILAPSQLLLNPPAYFKEMPFDFVLQMYLASCGNTYCFAEKMSAYRVFADGSWTVRMKENPQSYQIHHDKAIKVLDKFNQDTGLKYNDTIKETILWEEYKYHFNRKDFPILQKEPYRSCKQKKTLSLKNKVILFLGLYMPPVLQCEMAIKEMIKKAQALK